MRTTLQNSLSSNLFKLLFHFICLKNDIFMSLKTALWKDLSV